MKKLWALLLLVPILSSCTYQAMESEQPTGNFPPGIATIMTNSCYGTSCHTGATNVNDSLDLSTWDAMTHGSKYEYDVIPFSAAKSHLFEHINTNENLAAIAVPRMPLSRDPLSEADQKKIYDWINQGAKSNDGKIPYANVVNKVFVACEGEDVIAILDDDVRKMIRSNSIKTGSTLVKPSCIAMLPSKNAFVVGTKTSSGVTRKYSTDGQTLLGECNTGVYTNDIAITPDGKKGYVTDNTTTGLSYYGVFDAEKMQAISVMKSNVLVATQSAATSHDGKFVYISGGGSDNIGRIDTKSDTIIKLFRLAPDVPESIPSDYHAKYLPGYMTISPDDSRLYVGCQNSSEIVVFDLHTDSIIARIPLKYNPYGSALSPDGSELWVAAWGADQVKIVDTKTFQVKTTIDTVLSHPRSITFSRDGKVAYVTTEVLEGGVHNHGVNGGAPSSGIYVIDRASKKVIYTFSAAGYATGIVTNF